MDDHEGMKNEMSHDQGDYKKNSISLFGSVALGTGVMIGAGIFALIGQVAELAGPWLVLSFIIGAIVAGFSAYSYIILSNHYPSAGGIGMYLKQEYGRSAITGVGALLMAISMVINESLVARTFGSYLYQLFEEQLPEISIIIFAVILIVFSYTINAVNNDKIQKFEIVTSVLKMAGVLIFAVVGIGVFIGSDSSSIIQSQADKTYGVGGLIASIPLCILAYKGFTTITNSGSEIKDPHKNVGRSIVISLAICAALYALVTLSVTGNLSIEEIVEAKDYALAEAARPALGQLGVTFTVIIAVIATVSGIIASMFAVSRMSAMLVDMDLIPFYPIRKKVRTQKNTLIYIAGIALVLTLLFDMSRIAALGAIFYLVMDIAIHYGLVRKLKEDVKMKSPIVWTAIALDLISLVAFVIFKIQTDLLIVILALIVLIFLYLFEKYYLYLNCNNKLN